MSRRSELGLLRDLTLAESLHLADALAPLWSERVELLPSFGQTGAHLIVKCQRGDKISNDHTQALSGEGL